MHQIVLAYEGRLEMMRTIFGGGKDQPKSFNPKAMRASLRNRWAP